MKQCAAVSCKNLFEPATPGSFIKRFCSKRCKQRTSSSRWNRQHPKVVQAAHKRWMVRHPEKMTEYHRKKNLRRYQLTPAEREQMLRQQQYKCAICRKAGLLMQDHNHLTGQNRGLLCRGCNFALGFLKDNPMLLRAGLRYLRKYSC